jgi:hypothetical protein
MGRIVELCGVIAESAEAGQEGLVLPPADWERLSQDFTDEEIEDALGLVNESLYHSELAEAADSLSSRLLEVLGSLGDAATFAKAEQAGARFTLDVIGQLARRVDRLEEVLEVFRDGGSPDRRGFEALKRRLADQGIEEDMTRDPDEEPEAAPADGEDEDE